MSERERRDVTNSHSPLVLSFNTRTDLINPVLSTNQYHRNDGLVSNFCNQSYLYDFKSFN